MAQVPYTGVPSVTPSFSGATPNVSVNAPAEAFGGGIARGLEHLGHGVGELGGDLWRAATQLQEIQNRSEADRADSKFMEATAGLHANYNSLQGDAAAKALPDHIEALKKARSDVRGTLTNPAVQRMYDSQTLGTMGRNIFNAAGHAAQQTKVAAIDSVSQRMSTTIATAANSDDPAEVDAARYKLKGLNVQLHTLKGTTESIPDSEKVVNSSLDANVIRRLARTDPYAADQQLKAKKFSMTAEDYDRTDQVVTSQRRAVGATNIAQGIYNENRSEDGKPEVSLETMQEKARTKAREMAPDDPILEQHAVQSVNAIYNQNKKAAQDFRWTNNDTINTKIQSGVKDIQQLRADQEAAAAMDALPAKDRIGIPAKINAYNAARDKVANNDTYNQLKGLSYNDVESFLNTDITTQQLSQSQMNDLMKEQQKIKKQQGSDPRVMRAQEWMRGAFGKELEALGIFRRTDRNKDAYDNYTGMTQQALDLYQEEHKKPMPYKEFIDNVAPQLLRSKTIVPGFFNTSTIGLGDWGTHNEVPLVKGAVPDAFATQLKSDVIAAGGAEPSPEQIYRAWTRTEMMKLFKKKPTSGQ